ncbi:sensor histidine kinase [Paenibacillus sacheonensis]|uniref:HAMP domain-containing protein n=1 Tax=Paenibacillus sacheonensis TaxID=742054 RepID=A0A7X4YUL6_9BACL|nr:histidine kinase [Paenibacillus sacheonensis]MBM7567257.1 two-component system sensor histidine kinase YesM [Paenibacillus sacheonensis]NBC72848.1 HAMP domain-containing protein [Paenibacillus sacheonensis]
MPRIKDAKWMYTIFPKLVVAFLLLVTPLYGIGLIINKQGETSVRSEVSDSLQSRVKFYVNSLETEKAHMLGLLDQLAVDKNLSHLTFVGQFMKINEWSESVLALENKLQMIKASSIYIKSVEAHMLTQNRTISTEASITDNRLSDEYEAIAPNYSSPNRAFISWKDRLFLSLPFPTSAKKVPPSFAIQLELNLTTLRDALDHFTDYENSGAMFINLRQGWVVDNLGDEPQLPYVKDYLARQAADASEGTVSLRMDGKPFLVSYKYSEELDSYLVVYVPQEQLFGKIDNYKELLWLLSLLSIVIILIYSSWIYRMIHRPLNKLIRNFRKLEEGQWEHIRMPRSRDEFTDLMHHYNAMVDRLKVMFHEVVEQKTRAQASELKQLQSQINPHFLYNTYFILYRLAKAGQIDTLIRFCQYLGEYFQYITRSGADQVELESEIKHAQTYVEIQNIRFFNRIDVDFAPLPDSWRQVTVPRLIVQPVIENAYKHGLEKKRANCRIAIDFKQDGKRLFMTVEDNGESLRDEDLARLQRDLSDREHPPLELTGLLNIHRRLQIMFGDTAGIEVARGPMGGLQVKICMEAALANPHSNSNPHSNAMPHSNHDKEDEDVPAIDR